MGWFKHGPAFKSYPIVKKTRKQGKSDTHPWRIIVRENKNALPTQKLVLYYRKHQIYSFPHFGRFRQTLLYIMYFPWNLPINYSPESVDIHFLQQMICVFDLISSRIGCQVGLNDVLVRSVTRLSDAVDLGCRQKGCLREDFFYLSRMIDSFL